MNKQILDYLNANKNVMLFDDCVTISREKKTNNAEYITIKINDVVLYSFWNNPLKKDKETPPKHTGGKPSYIKQLLKANKNDISLEAAGTIQKLIPNIRWGDNLIIDIRSKKALGIKEIGDIIKKSKPVTIKIVNELKEAELLTKDKEGYKISPDLMQKGGGKI